MKSVTKQKPLEEVLKNLEGYKKIYIIGCGTCCTALHTGGRDEVLDMKQKLEQNGKAVTGWMVIPTPCDDLAKDALEMQAEAVEKADALLVMSCAFGVQTTSLYTKKPVHPALDTLFIGHDDGTGGYYEMCLQCGACVLSETGGICPITACPKELLNGPCGGYSHGKCEVDPNRDCAWVRIYQRLKELNRLDRLLAIQSPKEQSKRAHPHKKVGVA